MKTRSVIVLSISITTTLGATAVRRAHADDPSVTTGAPSEQAEPRHWTIAPSIELGGERFDHVENGTDGASHRNDMLAMSRLAVDVVSPDQHLFARAWASGARSSTPVNDTSGDDRIGTVSQGELTVGGRARISRFADLAIYAGIGEDVWTRASAQTNQDTEAFASLYVPIGFDLTWRLSRRWSFTWDTAVLQAVSSERQVKGAAAVHTDSDLGSRDRWSLAFRPTPKLDVSVAVVHESDSTLTGPMASTNGVAPALANEPSTSTSRTSLSAGVGYRF